MKALSNLCRFLMTTLLPLVLLAGVANAQQLPKSAAIGSNPPGSLFYALASGLAKIISDSTSVQTQVQPYSGTSTFFPLLDSGELDLGVVNAVDLGLAYQGPKRLQIGGRNPFPHTPNFRLIMRGSPLRRSLLVKKDSTIKTSDR
jgi:uncharacterized protein